MSTVNSKNNNKNKIYHILLALCVKEGSQVPIVCLNRTLVVTHSTDIIQQGVCVFFYKNG